MLKKSMMVLAASLALSTGAFAKDKIDIVFIGKNTGNPYFDSLTKGFVDACQKIACNFEFVAPATAEATSQIPFIEAQVQRGVDVIAISPNSPDALNQVFDAARAKGITILTVNGDITGNEPHRDATILPTDFTKVGADQVEMVGSLIGYEGEIAILSATTEAPDQNFWIQGMNEALKDPKYAKMKLVATVYGDDQPEKSTTEMEALLSNYPNLKGVIAPTTVGVAAAAQVVQSRGVAEQVKVTGLGLPSEMRDFIKDGTVKAFQLWSPYNEGWLAAHFSVDLKNGTVKNEVGATFDVPNLGTITINKGNSINTQASLTTFNAENIDEFNF
ncbi:substrate-binding domain-containing protein [Mesorhizobium sp. BAC0120]|uniref:substrate-binding domain-containing protein n=1 Tax=Mesorhizobium sp. BAC0120 TaxID=3090670 RepID=UPI00298CDB56|nr:substrate-binding domain-containing protein [Mesorhizobium sp. BAC0120]MDW6025201.1 substrate-binding domain-containing protein [Mesorhizobium sp. BAC0120]